MQPDRKSRLAFTLIEFLIALVIIGFIVAILVGVFSNPVKQAKLDSNVAQILDGIRQIQDGYNLCTTRAGVTNGFDCNHLNQVTMGILTAVPAVPAGREGGGPPITNWMVASHPTWYGDLTKADYVLLLPDVSEDICKAINEKQGHGSVLFDRTSDGNGIDTNPSYPDKGIHCANDWDDYYNGPGYMVIAPLAVDRDL